MSILNDILSGKSLEDLVDTPTPSEVVEPKLTQENVNLVLNCLKFQNGGPEGNEEFIGLGDSQIASKAGLTLEQVQEIKTARDSKIAELINPEPIE